MHSVNIMAYFDKTSDSISAYFNDILNTKMYCIPVHADSISTFLTLKCFFFLISGQQVTAPSAPADEFADAGIVMLENTSEEDIDSQIAVQQEIQQSLSWSRGPTLLLISQYKSKQSQIETGKKRKNKAFAEISETLKEHGYYFNHEQCASRLKTITRAYKNMKDHNNKSGNSRKSFEYEQELNDLYEKRPNIHPQFVLSSSTTSTQAKDDDLGNRQETEVARNKRPSSTDSETEGNYIKPSAPKSRKTQVSEVITFIQDMTKSQEERHTNEQMKREERHKEKMSVFKDLINVLKEKK